MGVFVFHDGFVDLQSKNPTPPNEGGVGTHFCKFIVYRDLTGCATRRRCLPSGFVALRDIRTSRVFVNSMSDLFHEEIPDDYVASVVDVMLQADWHLY